ncbi:unnamed protein product [Echinostoma caproni]|uniref:G_PROTEIN_RECEP_F1_2 domain-containing protein n=1 Tax=Echinostoma caproni TaxID=27848 RepID=A0A182ZZU4_9TREM|nr:unnamed protein product [Echinostoma caproni]
MFKHAASKLCEVYEKEEMSDVAAIFSFTVMSLLCVLGAIGNILVIVVYCVRPTRSFIRPFIVITPPNGQTNNAQPTGETPVLNNQTSVPIICDSPISFKSLHHRRTSNSLQTRLILLLAVVDLVTCLLILPWDILRSVRFAVGTASRMNQSDEYAPIEFTNWNQTTASFADVLAFIWSNDALTEILRLLRNVAFACEGSILAAIAVERYLTVVGSVRSIWKECVSITHCTPCTHLCDRYRKHGQNPGVETENNSQLSNTDQYWNEESFAPSEVSKLDADQMSTTQASGNFRWSTPSINRRCCCSSGDRCGCHMTCSRGTVCSKQTFIWSLILALCLSVLALELVIIMLRLRLGACRLSNSLREYTDKSYIMLTLFSFVLICYLYLCIFITVRQTDMRKNNWSSKPSAMSESRTSRPNMTANATRSVIATSPFIPSSNLELETRDTAIETQTPFEMARVYKYVSFATGSPSRLDPPVVIDPTTSTRSTSTVNCFRPREEGLTDTVQALTRPNPVPAGLRYPRAKSPFLRSRRTGLMLFTSTVVFYATLLPLLWVHLKWWLEDSDPSSHSAQGHSGMVVHHEFYYVNNAINVFIYSMFNSRFRERLHMVCAKRVRYY